MNNTLQFNNIPILHKTVDLTLTKEEINFIENQKFNGIENSVKVSTNIFVLNNKKMKRVKNYFITYVKDFVKNVLEIKNKFDMTSSWVTLNNSTNSHHAHEHHNSVLSLVYYVQCTGGDLTLSCNKSSLEQGFNFKYDIINYNSYNSRFINIPVKTNSIVIFPSWLTHSTQPNLSHNKRMVIAADFFPSGDLGSIENNDLININLKKFND